MRRAAHRALVWNTPLDESHAADLLQRLEVQPAAHVVDLGCGWAELLLRAVARVDGARGTGVDTDEASLARGRAAAEQRGLAGRVKLVAGDAAGWVGRADRVLCIGSTHAFGDSRAALRGLRSVAADGGRLLFGDGFWERPPTPHLEQMLGPQSGLDELVETASAAGWRQVHVSTAGQAEWDAFETTWVSGVREWADAHDGDDAAAARALAEEHWRDYAEGYRGVLGFAYLVLDAVS